MVHETDHLRRLLWKQGTVNQMSFCNTGIHRAEAVGAANRPRHVREWTPTSEVFEAYDVRRWQYLANWSSLYSGLVRVREALLDLATTVRTLSLSVQTLANVRQLKQQVPILCQDVVTTSLTPDRRRPVKQHRSHCYGPVT